MQKKLIQFLSTLFPTLVVNMAYKQLTNPQFRKLRENELEVLKLAKQETFPFQGFDIQLYTWEEGPQKVMLIHGWEGQAGNFSDMVQRLLKEGYTVYAFDGPSHGFSSKGATSLFEFSELVGVLIKRWGVNKLVSHSFGGVATNFSLGTNPGIEIEKYALLTTPDRFSDRIQDVSEMVGINEEVKNRLIKRIERETQIKVESLNVSDYAPKGNVKEALIIHDKNDKVIPIGQSRNVHQNWPASKMIEIEGTGHFRILRTDFVIDKVINFLAD